MLTLPIKREYFKMIENGEKPEEYRDITPYYMSRFKNIFDTFAKRLRGYVPYIGSRLYS